MKKKFGVLHFIAWVFRVLGVLSLIAALVAAIAALVFGFSRGFGMTGTPWAPRMMGNWSVVGPFLMGLLGGIGLYGAGEIIDLLLAIEENTRALRQQSEDKPLPPAGQ